MVYPQALNGLVLMATVSKLHCCIDHSTKKEGKLQSKSTVLQHGHWLTVLATGNVKMKFVRIRLLLKLKCVCVHHAHTVKMRVTITCLCVRLQVKVHTLGMLNNTPSY